jgi:hypothetical protein
MILAQAKDGRLQIIPCIDPRVSVLDFVSAIKARLVDHILEQVTGRTGEPGTGRVRGTITSRHPRSWECYTPKYRHLAEEAGVSTSPCIHTENPIRSGRGVI